MVTSRNIRSVRDQHSHVGYSGDSQTRVAFYNATNSRFSSLEKTRLVRGQKTEFYAFVALDINSSIRFENVSVVLAFNNGWGISVPANTVINYYPTEDTEIESINVYYYSSGTQKDGGDNLTPQSCLFLTEHC